MKQPKEFKIPPVSFPDIAPITEAARRLQQIALSGGSNSEGKQHRSVPENVVKCMAGIATNLWKARGKMIDPASSEVRDEMKRVCRHIDAAIEQLSDVGIEVKDHTGDAFDYGLPLKVVTAQPTVGISRETVLETLKPTVYWQNQLIQQGEVVIATPTTTQTE